MYNFQSQTLKVATQRVLRDCYVSRRGADIDEMESYCTPAFNRLCWTTQGCNSSVKNPVKFFLCVLEAYELHAKLASELEHLLRGTLRDNPPDSRGVRLFQR